MDKIKTLLRLVVALLSVLLLKTIKNYFKVNSEALKNLLLKKGFHPSIAMNPFIVFNEYNSKQILYINFWAKIVLEIFSLSVKKKCWKSEKNSQLLLWVGFKQAFVYDVDLLFDKTIFFTSYTEINIPENILIKEKVIVYSVMIGDYDEVLDPVYVSDNCDYILFTDNVNVKTKIWKVHLIQSDKNYSKKWNVCYYKFLVHRILPRQYNYSIYVDASILICGDIIQLFQYLNNNVCLAMIKHRIRCSMKQEIDICIEWKVIQEKTGQKQYQDYIDKGFPDDLGLVEAGVLIRKHSDVKVQKVMETWFDEFTKYPTRDQFSIMYSIWKNAMKNYCIIDGEVWSNQFMRVKRHRA